jgi:protein-L-isoaspartate O-methyltransferase
MWSWVKFHLTAWNTGGEGVHSPYLFEWVRMVMSDKHSFYGWSAIEDCRKAMLRDNRELSFVDYGSGAVDMRGRKSVRRICDIARGSLTKQCYAQMLSRLVNWLGGQLRDEDKGLTIVELGTSLGVTTAYMAAMDSRNRVVTFEGCEAVADVAKENWKALNMKNIECRVGEIDVTKLGEDIEQVDVAFIDANHTYVHTCEYFKVLANKVHEKSVIVVDDIHHSEEMERAWKEICADERVTSTMDLYQMGLVFFDPHYWKRNYIMRL